LPPGCLISAGRSRGGLRGLLGQRLDLGRHDRKTAAGSPAPPPRCGVERQQIGLAAMVLISSTTSPMRVAAFDNSLTRLLVTRA